MWRLSVAEGGKAANGEGPHKKHSVTESMHEKLRSQQPDSVEQWVPDVRGSTWHRVVWYAGTSVYEKHIFRGTRATRFVCRKRRCFPAKRWYPATIPRGIIRLRNVTNFYRCQNSKSCVSVGYQHQNYANSEETGFKQLISCKVKWQFNNIPLHLSQVLATVVSRCMKLIA